MGERMDFDVSARPADATRSTASTHNITSFDVDSRGSLRVPLTARSVARFASDNEEDASRRACKRQLERNRRRMCGRADKVIEDAVVVHCAVIITALAIKNQPQRLVISG